MQRYINPGADSIKSIRVIGKEEATLADRARNEFILEVLRAEVTLPKIDLIRMIWLPRDSEKPDPPKSVEVGSQSPFGKLNESQSNVVNAMTDTTTAKPPEHNVTGHDYARRGHFRYAGPPIIDYHAHVLRTRPTDPVNGPPTGKASRRL